jgi:hypothetical protein
MQRFRNWTVLALLAWSVVAAAAAEPTTVTYGMTIAGLPIGTATLVLTPNGSSTAVAVAGKLGGPLEIGRVNVSGVVTDGQVTLQSRSGSGKDSSSADLVSKGLPGNSQFSYAGITSRGPGRIAMTLNQSRVTMLDAAIPDNPKAVRVPVEESHKAGVVDPLSIIGQLIQPGGTMRPEAVCGRKLGVFTGQARFDLAGSALEERVPASGLPQGYRPLTCRVTFTPVSGHRIDKGSNTKARTATLVFARSEAGGRTFLWSLSVPALIGSFTLTAMGLN